MPKKVTFVHQCSLALSRRTGVPPHLTASEPMRQDLETLLVKDTTKRKKGAPVLQVFLKSSFNLKSFDELAAHLHVSVS